MVTAQLGMAEIDSRARTTMYSRSTPAIGIRIGIDIMTIGGTATAATFSMVHGWCSMSGSRRGGDIPTTRRTTIIRPILTATITDTTTEAVITTSRPTRSSIR